jgi:predicted RNase H-related nuclease YkuK (DUF458 family)
MDRIFQSLTNHQVIDLIPYLKTKLEESDDIKIYIGTDSQNIGSRTVYAMVIVLHYGNRGGHVVYSKKSISRIRDRFTRLWMEVEDSVALALHLEANGIKKVDFIDLDFNPDPKYKSNAVLRSALGYVESLGYATRCKPESISASYIADRICK